MPLGTLLLREAGAWLVSLNRWAQVSQASGSRVHARYEPPIRVPRRCFHIALRLGGLGRSSFAMGTRVLTEALFQANCHVLRHCPT